MHPLSHLGLVVVAMALGCGADPNDVSDLSDHEASPPQDAADTSDEVVEPPARLAFHTIELSLDVELPAGNAFDANVIAVDVELESPDLARYIVPAFVYEPFARSLDDDRERLVSEGPRAFRARFRPPLGSAPGTWRWRAIVTTAGERTEGAWELALAEVDPTGRGLVRRSERDRRYLVFEDGSPFFAVGENMAWYDRRGTFAYDDWLAKLAASGGNYIRIWMPSWAFGLEWTRRDSDGVLIESSLGDYTTRLDRAWQLDHVLRRAEELGIQVMLTLQNHGPFSTLHAGEWPNNPYNAANGGPLAEPTDFFDDPESRALFMRRLRYVVARWGHHANVFCWELWNEVDLVADAASEPVTRWTADMATALRELDPHDRLISTSLGGVDALSAWVSNDIPSLIERFAFWSMPELDFTQLHFYGFASLAIDFSRDLPRLATYLHSFDKPAFIAEAGVSPVSAEDSLAYDPDGIGFHDILWAGLFAETFGTGMNWWWDNLTDPLDYYPQFAAVADFVSGVRFDAEGFLVDEATASADHGPLQAQVLRGRDTVLVWVRRSEHQWFSPDASPVTGGQLTLSELPAGRWRATWSDPWRQEEVSISEIAVDGQTNLEIPTFTRDFALRLDRLSP